jgi:hypothetical protein
VSNRCLQAVTDELREAGVLFQVERGGKHWKVRFLHRGQHRMLTVSQSPSHQGSWLRARADARRILRQATERRV